MSNTHQRFFDIINTAVSPRNKLVFKRTQGFRAGGGLRYDSLGLIKITLITKEGLLSHQKSEYLYPQER